MKKNNIFLLSLDLAVTPLPSSANNRLLPCMAHSRSSLCVAGRALPMLARLEVPILPKAVVLTYHFFPENSRVSNVI